MGAARRESTRGSRCAGVVVWDRSRAPPAGWRRLVPAVLAVNSRQRRAHAPLQRGFCGLAPAAARPPDGVAAASHGVLLLLFCSRKYWKRSSPRHGHGGGHCCVGATFSLLPAASRQVVSKKGRGRSPARMPRPGRLRRGKLLRALPHGNSGRSGELALKEDLPGPAPQNGGMAAADPEAIHCRFLLGGWSSMALKAGSGWSGAWWPNWWAQRRPRSRRWAGSRAGPAAVAERLRAPQPRRRRQTSRGLAQP